MIWLVLLTGGIYIIVIASFFYGWEKLTYFEPHEDGNYPFVSVIVPMRNEEKNILLLIQDMVQQDYSSSFFEVIIVDDHSSDRSSTIATANAGKNIRVSALPEEISGKKAAIQYGINASRGEIILTIDADCRVGHQWIRSFVSWFGKFNPVMALAPVVAVSSAKMMEKVISLELFSLLGSTAGSAAIGNPVMCNGANLAFQKAVYPEIEHLYQNTKVKSGDDIFVLLEIKKKYPGRVHFMKSKQATVYTSVPSTIASFFRQRGRWVSKARFYRDPAIIFTAFAVFSMNVLLAIYFIYGIIQGNFTGFLILWLLKSLIDFPFLYQTTSFFGQKQLMLWFPLVQCFYFLYVCISVVVAFVAPIGWKGRNLF